jgi:hypothetical protein
MMENVLPQMAQLLATDLPGIQNHPKHFPQCTQAISLLEFLSGINLLSIRVNSFFLIKLYSSS